MSLDATRFGALPVSAWRNGAGRKADIESTPDWHVGFAWLDADAPFSDFTGHDRTITLVDGAGFTLAFTGRPALHVTQPYQPSAFDGGWPTQCRLSSGPCVVLNAMTKRGHANHRVTVSSADAILDITPVAGETAFLVLLAGAASVSSPSGSLDLGAKDSVRIHEPLSLRARPGSWVCTIAIVPRTGIHEPP